MPNRWKSSLCVVCLVVSAVPASAGDYRIVPGRRIGAVTLGMSRQAVYDTLCAPNQTRRLRDGIKQADWQTRRKFSRAAADHGDYWAWDFVTVYFRRGHVVQVEVNSPRFSTAGGLTTDVSPARWGKQFGPYRSTYQLAASHDPGGYPGTKHFIAYYDDAQRGIAWREGDWGNLDPGPDPGDPPSSEGPTEVAIVHMPGLPVITDPDGDARLVLTPAEAHL